MALGTSYELIGSGEKSWVRYRTYAKLNSQNYSTNTSSVNIKMVTYATSKNVTAYPYSFQTSYCKGISGSETWYYSTSEEIVIEQEVIFTHNNNGTKSVSGTSSGVGGGVYDTSYDWSFVLPDIDRTYASTTTCPITATTYAATDTSSTVTLQLTNNTGSSIYVDGSTSAITNGSTWNKIFTGTNWNGTAVTSSGFNVKIKKDNNGLETTLTYKPGILYYNGYAPDLSVADVTLTKMDNNNINAVNGHPVLKFGSIPARIDKKYYIHSGIYIKSAGSDIATLNYDTPIILEGYISSPIEYYTSYTLTLEIRYNYYNNNILTTKVAGTKAFSAITTYAKNPVITPVSFTVHSAGQDMGMSGSAKVDNGTTAQNMEVIYSFISKDYTDNVISETFSNVSSNSTNTSDKSQSKDGSTGNAAMYAERPYKLVITASNIENSNNSTTYTYTENNAIKYITPGSTVTPVTSLTLTDIRDTQATLNIYYTNRDTTKGTLNIYNGTSLLQSISGNFVTGNTAPLTTGSAYSAIASITLTGLTDGASYTLEARITNSSYGTSSGDSNTKLSITTIPALPTCGTITYANDTTNEDTIIKVTLSNVSSKSSALKYKAVCYARDADGNNTGSPIYSAEITYPTLSFNVTGLTEETNYNLYIYANNGYQYDYSTAASNRASTTYWIYTPNNYEVATLGKKFSSSIPLVCTTLSGSWLKINQGGSDTDFHKVKVYLINTDNPNGLQIKKSMVKLK